MKGLDKTTVKIIIEMVKDWEETEGERATVSRLKGNLLAFSLGYQEALSDVQMKLNQLFLIIPNQVKVKL